MKDDCLFCKIINKEVDSLCLYEDDDIMAILDAYPDCDGHTLIIPKKHITDIMELDSDTLGKMQMVAKKIIKVQLDKLDKKSLTVLFNYGDSQIIKHVHMHLLPGYKDKDHKYSREEVYDMLKGEIK